MRFVPICWAQVLGAALANVLQPHAQMSQILRHMLLNLFKLQANQRSLAQFLKHRSPTSRGLKIELAAVLAAHSFNLSAPFMVLAVACLESPSKKLTVCTIRENALDVQSTAATDACSKTLV